jgi:hypothetical protein
VGFPNETKKDFGETVRFIKKNARLINFFQNNKYYVIPYSSMGKFPDRYGIELVKDAVSYESLCRDNKMWFLSGKDLGAKPNNFHIYRFDEIGGRNHEEVDKEGYRRIMYLHGIQRKEFTDIRQMLILMDGLSRPTPKKADLFVGSGGGRSTGPRAAGGIYTRPRQSK